MSMDLSELRAEVRSQGLSDATESDLDRWINRSIREITNARNWPWRERHHVEPAPVTWPVEIADLAHVLKIVQGDRVLTPSDMRVVLDHDPELDDRGHGVYWYMRGRGLYVWPSSSKEVGIYYTATPDVLVSPSDEASSPAEFDELIVSGARIRGYLRNQSYDALANEREHWGLVMQEMANAYQLPNHDSTTSVHLTGAGHDYV